MNKWRQELYTAFNEAFQAGGSMLTLDQLERLRRAVGRIGIKIEEKSKETAIDLVRKLQEGVSEAFKKVGNDLDDFDRRLKALEEKVEDQGEDRSSG